MIKLINNIALALLFVIALNGASQQERHVEPTPTAN